MEDLTEAIQLDWELIHLHKQCTAKLLADRNIHFGQPPLLFTMKRLGTCSQADLAHELHVSPATITVSLKRMEKAGFLKRVPDPNDLRANRVALTKEGEKAADWAQKTMFLVQGNKYAGLTEQEFSQLLDFYSRMKENLSRFKAMLEEQGEYI